MIHSTLSDGEIFFKLCCLRHGHDDMLQRSKVRLMTCTTDTTQNLCLIPGGEFVESTVHDTKLQGWGDSYDGPCVRLKQRGVTAEIIIPATEWASLLRVLIKRQTELIKKLQAGHRATAERRLFELETELTNIENSCN